MLGRCWGSPQYGKHHHPLGLSGSHAGCDVLSYSRRPAEEPISRSLLPGGASWKTVKWSRPTAEEVCGGRNRPGRRCRCTRVSGWDAQSRRTVESRPVCVIAARDQLSISSPASRRQTRHVRPMVGDCRRNRMLTRLSELARDTYSTSLTALRARMR